MSPATPPPKSSREPVTRRSVAAAAASPFRRRTAVVLAVVGGLALAAVLGYRVFGPEPESVGSSDSAGGHRSAVGYRTLIELLSGDVPVEPARGQRPMGLGEYEPLLVLEPGGTLRRHLGETLDAANNAWAPMVIVLPKWVAVPHNYRPGWAGELSAVPRDEAASVAREAVSALLNSEAVYLDSELEDARDDHEEAAEGEEKDQARAYVEGVEEQQETLGALRAMVSDLAVLRPGQLTGFRGEEWARGAELARPQLLTDPSGMLQPVAAYEEGLLIARLPNLPVYLVSDPDLWNVAGLPRGDNAVIAHHLFVEELLADRVWVKEGRHGGMPAERSVWEALLKPPLAWVTLQIALVALLAVWLAAAPFGRPRPAPPRVPPGKGTLVDNTARLLGEAGDPASSVERYLGLIEESAAQALGLPPGLSPEERLKRLDALGRQRGSERPLHVLAGGVGRLPARGAARRRKALELAQDLYEWHRHAVSAQHNRPPGSAGEGGS